MCTVHLILPWIVFFCVSLYLEISLYQLKRKDATKNRSRQYFITLKDLLLSRTSPSFIKVYLFQQKKKYGPIFNILVFPISIFLKKCILEIKLTKKLAKEETDPIKKEKDTIKAELEYIEKK